jgi:hypothetical protein
LTRSFQSKCASDSGSVVVLCRKNRTVCV